MPITKKTLEKYLVELRRIAQHRTEGSEKKIRRIYKALQKDLQLFLANQYEKYAIDDQLTYAILQQKGQYANFLENVQKHVDEISPQLSKEITQTVKDTYKTCFDGMIDCVKKTVAGKAVLNEVLSSVRAVTPSIIKRAVENPISGLTLADTLEKNRKEIIYNIKQNIGIGLVNGDRYSTMARRITDALDGDYKKSIRIVRTETHRNIESGFMDCAEYIQEEVSGSDYIYAVTWKTMGDERVRPQQRHKKNGKWVTTFSQNGANHMKMENVTVKAGDFFNLGNGIKAKCPGQSGSAANDCHCRCFLEYNLMAIDEFKKATGKNVTTTATTKTIRQNMTNSGIVDLGLERTTNDSQFDIALRKAKNSEKNGACVDTHHKNELETFKLLLSKDGMAGVAVKPDGDITAVFKNQDANIKGAVNDLIITARVNGGEKMDCYGKYLANAYECCGYEAVARVPFNADYVDDPFLLKTSMDVYVLKQNTDGIDTVIKKNVAHLYKVSTQDELNNLPTFTDYDEALHYRDELLEKQKSI